MRNFTLLFIVAFLCQTFSVIAQNTPADPGELSETYSEYFSLNREAVFLHLNKTQVAPGEGLWFTAYNYSPQFLKPNFTTNLHVNLYNSEGILLEAKVVNTENGQGQGYFELNPEKYPPGTYLLKAGTKYMENFREDSRYSQSFRILGTSNIPIVEREYDLQLLPEGGHLLADVDNTVGVKLLDNAGKGIRFKQGKVLDSKQQVVTTFKSNRFGLSKFRYTPLTGETYSVVIDFGEGESLQQAVPAPEPFGIALSTSQLKDQLLFTFRTNDRTYESLKDKTFLFAFHKDGAMKALNFVFNENDHSANLTLKSDALYSGMNSITVFNEKMEPVLERLVFNRDSIDRKQVSAAIRLKEADSLVLGLSSAEDLGMHSLSISVLPAETISYNPANNIFSAFYIEPYIKGDLEDGGYYFSEKVDLRRRDYDLDLLLLTQGWSRYSWRDIFNNPPKEHFQHEQGFSIRGRVVKRNPKKHKNVYISSSTDRLSIIADLAEDGSFSAENLFLKDSAQVSFSLMNDRNNEVSKPQVVVNVSPMRNTENIAPPGFLKTALPGEIMEMKVNAATDDLPENFIQEGEVLGTVYLEGKTMTPQEIQLEEERKLNRGEMYGRYDLISEWETKTNPTIFSLLLMKGFEVKGDHVYSRRELRRKPPNTNWILPARAAVVLIDGLESDVHDLRALLTSEVEYIYTNQTGAGVKGAYYNGAGGGYIEIKLKDSRWLDNRETAAVRFLGNGFSPSKEFYTPKYSSYSSQAFSDYGSIGWFPEVSLEEGNSELKIFNTRLPIKLFIEGMTEEGALISEEVVIDPESRS